MNHKANSQRQKAKIKYQGMMKKHGRFFMAALCLLPCHAYAASESYLNYLKGLMEERAGNMGKALEAYETVVKQDPQALQVYRDIAELHLRMGQPDAALQAAERVKELAPKDPSSFIFLGNVRVAQGNLAKAAEAYEQALQLDPQNLRALENLGNYYAMLDPDKALSYYQRYITLQPRDADMVFQMALVYQKKGDSKKAFTLYKESLQQDPQQLASHLALADLYEQEKSTEAALSEYTVASQLQPGNPMILMRLGHLYYREGRWDDAAKAFKTVAETAPQDATVHYWLARVAEEKKDWTRAAAEAEKAYTLSNDPQFLPLTAYYLTLDRQIEPALHFLEKARENDPENANVLLFLGMNYLDSNQLEKSRDVLAKGVSLYARDPQMRFHLGIAEDRLGHFDEAVKQFRALLEIDPKNAAALNYLGYSLTERGIQLPEAEKMLRQAVALEPDNGAYLDSLGWVRFKRGAPGEAREFLEKAVQATPDALIFDHLADVYMAQAHPQAAVQSWVKAAALDPKNTAVQKKLKDAFDQYVGKDTKPYRLYLEGNLRQAKNLQTGVAMQARWGRRPMKSQGRLYYARPDRLALDLAGTENQAPLRLILEDKRLRMDPPDGPKAMSGVAAAGLATVVQFLSGQLTEAMDVSWDAKRGVVTRFKRTNPVGGTDDVDIFSYVFNDGLWLPGDMRIKNTTVGWEATLQFSEWTVNHPENEKLFSAGR